MSRTVFFIGGTGYIGSTVLDRIAKADPNARFTIYGRKPDVLKEFEAIDPRFKSAQGSLSDYDRLEELASKHQVTVNCADADNLDATNAILRGMRKRFEATGVRPILIHTSGTGTLSDDNPGTAATDKVYTDGDAEPDASPPLLPLSSLPANAFHRNVDLAIVRADAAGYVQAYIILPSTIYGLSKTVFADKGLCNPQSQQVPLLIRMSLDRGAAAMVGTGSNLWPNVHIDDCADLFAIVYKEAFKASGGDHGTRGYYFAENGEHSLKQVAEQIGKVLKDKGLVSSATPTTLSEPELDKYMTGSTYLGTNSRARAVHSRKIGWEPKHNTEDFLASIADDVEWTIANSRGKDAKGEFVWGSYPKLVNGAWTV